MESCNSNRRQPFYITEYFYSVALLFFIKVKDLNTSSTTGFNKKNQPDEKNYMKYAASQTHLVFDMLDQIVPLRHCEDPLVGVLLRHILENSCVSEQALGQPLKTSLLER